MRSPGPESASSQPHLRTVGVILAGGRGRRIGGSKATVELRGRPLISYPLQAIAAVLGEVVVLAKADTQLPSMPGATVWIETQSRHHPAVGILQALGLAGGRPVLVCAVDLPFVTPELVRRLITADPGQAPAVVASERGQMQPLLGYYQPRALALLESAAGKRDRPLRELVGAIDPLPLEVDDPDALFNINAPEDLLQAAAILDRRRGQAADREAKHQPNVKS